MDNSGSGVVVTGKKKGSTETGSDKRTNGSFAEPPVPVPVPQDTKEGGQSRKRSIISSDEDISNINRTTSSNSSNIKDENSSRRKSSDPHNVTVEKVMDGDEDGAQSYVSLWNDHEDDPKVGDPNIFGRVVVGFRLSASHFISTHKAKFNMFFIVIAALLYNAYLAGAIHYAVVYKKHIDWCDGVGVLIVITALFYWSFFYYLIIKRHFGAGIQNKIFSPIATKCRPITSRPIFSYGLGLLIFGGVITFVVIDTLNQPKRLISAAGVFVILFLGLLISKYPGRVKWSAVLMGIGLQFLFGVILLKWGGGRQAFNCLSNKVKIFLEFTNAGSGFVYNYLVTGDPKGDGSLVFPGVFAFSSLSVIFFFSFFISILYHYGVMMWIVTKVGWLLQVVVGTTAAESMNAAANIFVGMIEAPILIKPFLLTMTKSELNTVMTGGFATIAGTVMGAYISFGINPSYLLSASIMAAPAALATSKLIYPEIKLSKTTADQIKTLSLSTKGNALDAAAQGAAQGVMLVGNIIANVIAFMAFVAFLNAMLSWFGTLLGWHDLSFEYLLGKVFIPVAYMIGIDSEETEDVALLLGLKTVVNEFVAYQRLSSKEMAHLSCRSRAIATYALCSFSNFSSIGITLGGLGIMAAERRKDLAEVISYSFIAGSACGLLNACIAGTLLDAPGYDRRLVINGTYIRDC